MKEFANRLHKQTCSTLIGMCVWPPNSTSQHGLKSSPRRHILDTYSQKRNCATPTPIKKNNSHSPRNTPVHARHVATFPSWNRATAKGTSSGDQVVALRCATQQKRRSTNDFKHQPGKNAEPQLSLYKSSHVFLLIMADVTRLNTIHGIGPSLFTERELGKYRTTRHYDDGG